MAEDYRTIPEMFLDQVDKCKDKEALRFKDGSEWKSITYSQWKTIVFETARGIFKDVKPNDNVCLLSENRPEWTFADLAIIHLGACNVPIYPTNPPKDIAYIINDCEAKLIFVSNQNQLKKIQSLMDAKEIPKIKRIICFEKVQTSGIIETLDQTREKGKEVDDAEIMKRVNAIKEDDLFTLIYTSGTTGTPKGVMLTHKNMIRNVVSCGKMVPMYHDDVALSFLPLSHSLERMAGYYSMVNQGAIICYAESVEKLVDNLGEVKPTILVSVPRIYEKVYAKVKSNAKEGLKKTIFDWALNTGKEKIKYDFAKKPVPAFLKLKYSIAFKLVFSKLHAVLGGRLRYSVSGGAPLAGEIGEFLFAAGLTVLEGYGLSETSPVLSVNAPGEARIGSVGKPLPDVEIKILPEPDREKDGEILARGPNVMKGYWKKEKETKEVLEPDGFFHTGDIGYIDKDGFLFITDRKKELLKTSGGKYVAPQPIENQLKLHPLIEQAVVIGNRLKYCVALIVPEVEGLQNWAKENKIAYSTMEDLVSNAKVKDLFQSHINEVNKPLGKWENIKDFKILSKPFSQETGELTPTLKLKRRIIDEKYKDVIDSMYND